MRFSFRKREMRNALALLCGLSLTVFIYGCGKGDADKAKLTVKVMLTAVPQSDSWSGKFDELTVKGKLKGGGKAHKGELKTRFKKKKELSIEDERGIGAIFIEKNLKPGSWDISLKYERDGNILEMNKGVGKCEVNLAAGKSEKVYFSYSSEKGFTKITAKEASLEERDFVLNKQHRMKEIKPPPEPEPDYEAEGY